MVNVGKLTSIGVSVTILAILIISVFIPLGQDAHITEKEYYKNEDTGKYVNKQGQDVDNIKDAMVKTEGYTITGIPFINSFIQLIPLLLSIGALLIIVDTFKRPG